MIHSFAYGYWGIAYAYEKLNKIKESLIWINKGLDIYPEDIYYLNFKSNLLIEHWGDDKELKEGKPPRNYTFLDIPKMAIVFPSTIAILLLRYY